MSWSSRLGGWASGRFSPFSTVPREVTNDDFSYITADEIDSQDPSHQSMHANTTHRHGSRQSSSSPDIIVVRHQKISYPLRFPAHSIADNSLSIATLRHEAARALPAAGGQAARVRLFFRGRNLKDDSRTARDEGLRPDDEILCVVGEPLRTDGDADESEESDGVDTGAAEPGTAGRRKRRNRKGKKKGKGGAGAGGGGGSGNTSGTASPLPSDVRPEHLPIPAALHPLTNGSPSPTPSAKQTQPQTALQKLDALSATFDALVPKCERFEAAPPTEAKERDFEHKKLTETILQTVLFKLDAVETEGDEEARARRKALVKFAQGWLNRLDAVVK